jgi:multidrug efflux pump subunit AcrB
MDWFVDHWLLTLTLIVLVLVAGHVAAFALCRAASPANSRTEMQGRERERLPTEGNPEHR